MTDVLTRLRTVLSDRYHFERELGAGGMATVYLARDVRHDRPVAIKVLHPDLAAAMGSERFLAEIKTTAKLQHPNTLTLIDSGVADGLLFYVMPLVTGESLRERLLRARQLSIEDAVRIATEVADALDDAHRHGIVHRDIKPENILLQGGHAVVADFGIALAVQEAGGQRLTQTGLSLGTPAYMSPEQAMGDRAVDARADIYALGAVLYEMLVGEPPFTGPTLQAIVAKVITEKPVPPSIARDTVPPNVEYAVLKALAKLPADRFASAADFARALATTSMHAAVADQRGVGRSRPRVATMVAAGVALLVAGWALGRAMSAAPGGANAVPVHLELALPSFVATYDRGFAISPDGQTVAYTGSEAGVTDVRVTRLSDGVQHTIQGSGTAMQPFFSPDGKSIGYRSMRDGHIFRAASDGAMPAEFFTSARITENAYFVWVAPDTIFAASVRAIYRLIAGASAIDTLHVFGPTDGYKPTDMTRTGDILLISTNWPTVQTLAFDPSGKTLSTFATGYRHAMSLPSKRVLLSNASGDLLAGIVDPSGTRLAGTPVPVLRGIQGMSDSPLFTISATGTLIHPLPARTSRLVFVDRTGRATARASVCLRTPRFSPNGLLVTGTQGGGCKDESTAEPSVWVYEIARDLATRLWVGGQAAYPSFTHDGKRVVYSANPEGTTNGFDLFVQDVTGGPREVFVAGALQERDITLTRDGQLGAYRVRKEGEQNDIWLLDRRTTPPTSRPLVATPNDELMPSLSPDGAWLAYVSDKSATRREVWITDFPAAARHYQVSRDGGNEPAWGPNGKELYYRHGDEMMVVALTTTGDVKLESPRPLFRGEYVESPLGRMYDVNADGTRFVLEEASPTSHVRVILNWFATWPKELRP